MWSEGLFGYACGVFTGITLIASLQSCVPDSSVNVTHKAIADCEKSLPRDQKCVIIAVPLSKDKL
jgi:hypothetical protein